MPELNNKNFNHLKIHTQYSICEGAVRIDELRDRAKELKMNPNDISCKATTTDGLGYEGAREGISTQAIALVKKN